MAMLGVETSVRDVDVPDELLASVVAHFAPLRVILFGSHARGEAGPDSDLDLLVILDDQASDHQLGWRAAFEVRKDVHRAVDIVACQRGWFEDERGVIGSLAHMAAEGGIVLYEHG
jgi:predicted nucleotidyltransferase